MSLCSNRGVLSLGLTLVLAAGCGSDDGESTSGGSTSGDATGASTDTTAATDGSSGSAATSGSTASGSDTASGGGTTSGATGSTGASGSSGGATSSGGSTGGAGLTWSSFAEEFFGTYCTECHGAGDAQGRDYTMLAEVEQEAAAIRCGVSPVMLPDCGGQPSPNQFPVGGGPKPSDMEREALVQWIDAGLPP